MPLDDASLIRRCLSGESSGWTELVDRYWRLVYSVPRRFGLSSTDCEDTCQTVFMILHRRLSTLRESDALSGWLITTAQRECWRVARQRRKLSEQSDNIADGAPPTAELVAELEQAQVVRSSLKQLGGNCEKLLVALFIDAREPDYETIALEQNLPIGSIGPTRARCLEKLAKILKQRGL